MKDIFQRYEAVVFFDTETTGLDADSCQIIELAAIRIEQHPSGSLRVTASGDLFVQLPEGQKIPENVVKLTGITDKQLKAEGVTEAEAAEAFTDWIRIVNGPVLLVAHNAQFDLLFARAMLHRHNRKGEELLGIADKLDTLTVFKDRRPYPHKLENAISAYRLQDKAQNTHRAIDDVQALLEVFKAMQSERPDLLNYVNLFGYNPKYGVSGRRIDGVTYWPQQFSKYMQAPGFTLPEKVRRIKK